MSIQKIRNRLAPGSFYRSLPFVYFLAFLGILYIANVHYAERNMRKIESLKKEVNESRWKYLSVKSDVMKNSMPSEISDNVAQLDIGLSNSQPIKITYKEQLD